MSRYEDEISSVNFFDEIFENMAYSVYFRSGKADQFMTMCIGGKYQEYHANSDLTPFSSQCIGTATLRAVFSSVLAYFEHFYT